MISEELNSKVESAIKRIKDFLETQIRIRNMVQERLKTLIEIQRQVFSFADQKIVLKITLIKQGCEEIVLFVRRKDYFLQVDRIGLYISGRYNESLTPATLYDDENPLSIILDAFSREDPDIRVTQE